MGKNKEENIQQHQLQNKVEEIHHVDKAIEESHILRHNPPCIIFRTGNIDVCQGCPQKFGKDNMKPPNNMVIRWMGYKRRPTFPGSKQRITEKKRSPMHFHARDLQCIMKKNPYCKIEEMYK